MTQSNKDKADIAMDDMNIYGCFADCLSDQHSHNEPEGHEETKAESGCGSMETYYVVSGSHYGCTIIPEGLAVGVSFGAVAKFPEVLAVSLRIKWLAGLVVMRSLPIFGIFGRSSSSWLVLMVSIATWGTIAGFSNN
ncbi:hypothetical protein CVS40_5890 [Lucilia cuprina]|nr:hypothetical protein CVS40_5890 [Lucilia cuprina]